MWLRLVILGVVAWLLYRLWSSFKRRISHRRENVRDAPQKMVSCEQCGVYVPEKDAVSVDGRFYCCRQHRDDHTVQDEN